MNKQRITNLIGAGTMAALILAIGLLLSDGNRPDASAQTVAPVTQSAKTLSAEELQAQNAALQQSVTTYQQRETEFTAQIELANELLAEQSANAYAGEEYEEDEDDETSYEEEEHEEDHEDDDEYEYEEDDD